MNERKSGGAGSPGREGSPYVHLVQAGDLRFVLDLHTNRMFALEPQEAAFFEAWLQGEDVAGLAETYPEAARVLAELRDQGLFCCDRPKGLAFGWDWKTIEDHILHKRERTILEITQACNLRCRYCTFGGGFEDHRHHSSVHMGSPLLRKSILAAIEHGRDLEAIGMGFYGGEPLLAFDLVQEAVSFGMREAPGKRIRWSLTTNGTLIDAEKAAFLRDHEFTVLVSLDGPRAMHDRYRIYPDGRGSYDHTIRGLRTLLEVYGPEGLPKIGLNMVVPSMAWVAALAELWEQEPWLPRALRTSVTVVNAPEGLELPEPPARTNSKRLLEDWLERLKKGEPPKTTLQEGLFDENFAKLHQRPTAAGYRKTFFPNGCCIPGARRIYVQAQGTYQICERVHGVPTIGSVEGGVDLAAIERLVSDYCQQSFQDCRECFLVSNCNMCFMQAYRCGSFDLAQKRDYCRSTKAHFQSRLAAYGQVSQEFPHKLGEWEGYDIH